MKANKPYRYWLAMGVLATCLVAAIILAGCGSGEIGLTDSSTSGGGMIIGGVGVGGTGVVKSAALETAADYGLIGAIVFVDKNNNRLPDPDEPYAVTDQNGNYTLQVDPAESVSYPLLMQAVAEKTMVKATGQVVASTYVIDLGQTAGGR